MAKKLKARSGKTAAKRSSKPSAKRRKGLRQPTLPGAEGMRSKRLDLLCEELGDIRDKKNKLARDEKEAISSSLAEMQRVGTHSYKHDGIVMSRLPGAEKLTVRV